MRVLRGLVPTISGSLMGDSTMGRGDVMFVPQKPFLTNGTLKEQVGTGSIKNLSYKSDDRLWEYVVDVI